MIHVFVCNFNLFSICRRVFVEETQDAAEDNDDIFFALEKLKAKRKKRIQGVSNRGSEKNDVRYEMLQCLKSLWSSLPLASSFYGKEITFQTENISYKDIVQYVAKAFRDALYGEKTEVQLEENRYAKAHTLDGKIAIYLRFFTNCKCLNY